jgi:2-(1,2-epoxy-1,2-dihydrophenyl)acetyl-CoA isomerase
MQIVEPIELARQLYQALEAGDRQLLRRLLHPQFSGSATEGLPFGLGGSYAGPEAMCRDFWGKIGKNFRAKVEASEFRMLDDGRLLVRGRYVGQGRASGATLDAEFIHLLRFADGQIIGLTQLTDSERWVQAAADQPAPGGAKWSTLEFSVEAGLATLRLNRPAEHNAINLQMAEELRQVASLCAGDDAIRALLVFGNGNSFTVGGDLTAISKAVEGDVPKLLRSMIDPYHVALETFSRLNIPIVAGIHGAAAGGGLGLIHCADIVLAADNTKVTLGFGSLGLSTDGGNSWFLPRLLGQRRAAELYFEDRVLNAGEALEWGLVTRVVPLAALSEQALACAKRLAEGPARAYAEIKRLFRDSSGASLPAHLAAEKDAICRSAATSDAVGAIASFVGKRKPVFNGS